MRLKALFVFIPALLVSAVMAQQVSRPAPASSITNARVLSVWKGVTSLDLANVPTAAYSSSSVLIGSTTYLFSCAAPGVANVNFFPGFSQFGTTISPSIDPITKRYFFNAGYYGVPACSNGSPGYVTGTMTTSGTTPIDNNCGGCTE